MSFYDELSPAVKAKDADDIEREMSMGSVPPEGLHHAVLDGFREVTSDSGLKGRELKFLIIGGPARGMHVKDTLWKTDNEKGQTRMLIFGHRLGLLRKVNEGGKNRYVPVDGKSDFNSCFGAQVIIDVTHEQFDKKDGKGKGIAARLSFEGLLALDDKRAEKVARGSAAGAGAGAAATPSTGGGGSTSHSAGGAATAAAGAAHQRDFSDL